MPRTLEPDPDLHCQQIAFICCCRSCAEDRNDEGTLLMCCSMEALIDRQPEDSAPAAPVGGGGIKRYVGIWVCTYYVMYIFGWGRTTGYLPGLYGVFIPG